MAQGVYDQLCQGGLRSQLFTLPLFGEQLSALPGNLSPGQFLDLDIGWSTNAFSRHHFNSPDQIKQAFPRPNSFGERRWMDFDIILSLASLVGSCVHNY